VTASFRAEAPAERHAAAPSRPELVRPPAPARSSQPRAGCRAFLLVDPKQRRSHSTRGQPAGNCRARARCRDGGDCRNTIAEFHAHISYSANTGGRVQATIGQWSRPHDVKPMHRVHGIVISASHDFDVGDLYATWPHASQPRAGDIVYVMARAASAPSPLEHAVPAALDLGPARLQVRQAAMSPPRVVERLSEAGERL
jgi:hypothetical protein